MLIMPTLIVLPIPAASKEDDFGVDNCGNPAAWIQPATLAANALTMFVWLAGVAVLARLLGGRPPLEGAAGALLALAIMLVS